MPSDTETRINMMGVQGAMSMGHALFPSKDKTLQGSRILNASPDASSTLLKAAA